MTAPPAPRLPCPRCGTMCEVTKMDVITATYTPVASLSETETPHKSVSPGTEVPGHYAAAPHSASATPRTDAAELPIKTGALCSGHVEASFARELERELAEAKEYGAEMNRLNFLERQRADHALNTIIKECPLCAEEIRVRGDSQTCARSATEAPEIVRPGKAPHSPAAFINALAEEGSKAELVQYLQETWNDYMQLLKEKRALKAPRPEEKDTRAPDLRLSVARVVELIEEIMATTGNHGGDTVDEKVERGIRAGYAEAVGRYEPCMNRVP